MLEKKSIEPNFKEIDPAHHGKAYDVFNKRDVPGILRLVSPHNAANLLEDNIYSFLHAGIYEEVLFEVMIYGATRHPEVWTNLISYCDREKLRSIGDPIPTEPITVYRGVTCCHGFVDTCGKVYSNEELDDQIDVAYDIRDFIRGYAWTTNKNTAAWFADHTLDLCDDGAVFYAEIKPEDIIFCTNQRGDEVVVVDILKLPEVLKGFETLPEPIEPGSMGDQ